MYETDLVSNLIVIELSFFLHKTGASKLFNLTTLPNLPGSAL